MLPSLKGKNMLSNPVKSTLFTLAVSLLLFLPVQVTGDQGSSTDKTGIIIDFDEYSRLPQGFKLETTGHSRYTAQWHVVTCGAAPSPPNVLRITEIKAPSGGQFNICWTDSLKFTDGTIEVKVRADAGRIDQGGGPMWRVTDRSNYYVARLNPLEDNFRIYFVKKGRRVMIATAGVQGIKAGQWFTIRIDFQDDRITGWVNGGKLIDVRDTTFSRSGGIGLWTKADAASSFDDLAIRISD